MAIRGGQSGRAARAATLTNRGAPLALLVVLLLVVAAVSGDARDGVRTSPDISSTVGDYLFTALVLAYIATGVVALAAIVVGVRMRKDWEAPPTRLQSLVSLLVFLGVVALLALAVFNAPERPPRRAEVDRPVAGEIRPEDERARRTPPAQFRWELPAVLAGLLGIGAAAYVVRRRRVDVLPPRVHEEVAVVLDETLDDLRAEQDFRRAVVAAYARLEQVLARHGTPRREAEAPFEYLGRVLAELEVSEAAARRLTELFERAKFSTHAIDAGMKEDAIEAVVTVRDELRAAA